MRSGIARLALGLTFVSAIVGLTVPHAMAATDNNAAPDLGELSAALNAPTYDPGDFKDCPKLPSGAKPQEWLCVQATSVEGTMKLNKVTAKVDKPLRFTYAIGPKGDIFGGVKAEPLSVPGGLLGIPGSENFPGMMVGALAQSTGYFDSVGTPGHIKVGLKIKLQHALLGSRCSIGSDKNAIKLDLTRRKIEPGPGGNLLVTFGDDKVAIPAAKGCGNLLPWLLGCGELDPILNARVGLPAVAGQSSISLKALVKIHSYKDLPNHH